MGRIVIAHENLVEALCTLSKCGGFVPGLIIGQCAVPGQKDYVVHLPATPVSEGEDKIDVGKSYEKLTDIDDNVILEHARVVTRMLPGGMWVLGFYVVGPGDIFSDKNSLSKLRSIANKVHMCTKGNDFMNGKDPSNQKMVLHFSSSSKKYVCKTIEMDNLNSSIRPVDWKFKSYTTSWMRVESVLDFEWLPPFFASNNVTTKKKLQECLKKFKEHLDTLKYSINGNFCEANQLLSSIEEPSKENGCDNEEDSCCKYNLIFFEFMEPPKNKGKTENALVVEEDWELKFDGYVASTVFLHEKSTAEDAVKAVKDDLVRSMASRFEMHWQTVEEPESVNEESKYVIRSPPRRVLFQPEGFEVAFSEYVFEGETEEEALLSITENLGFSDCKIIVLENDFDPAKTSKIVEDAEILDGSPGNPPTKDALSANSTNSLLMYGITAAFVTLLISLLVHLLYS